MLRLTLEMVPFGVERDKYQIGIVEIANVGGDHEIGNYVAVLGRSDKKARVSKFSRALGGWKLAAKAIKALKL